MLTQASYEFMVNFVSAITLTIMTLTIILLLKFYLILLLELVFSLKSQWTMLQNENSPIDTLRKFIPSNLI